MGSQVNAVLGMDGSEENPRRWTVKQLLMFQRRRK